MNITKELLHEMFDYQDGELIWKSPSKYKPQLIGKPAGAVNKVVGYKYLKINRKMFLVHRLVFMYHHGFLPSYVDHKNGNPLDNRIENLREATISQNNMNSKVSSKNSLGYKGIDKIRNKYRARVYINRNEIHIGMYDTLEDAIQAVKIKREEVHGEFCRHD